MKNIWKAIAVIGLLSLVVLSITQSTLPAVIAQGTTGETTAQKTPVEVEPELLARFARGEEPSYLIYFHDKADLSAAHDMDWEARGWYVMETLQAAADASQKEVRGYLEGQRVPYQAFWIDNLIVVQSSDFDTLNGLLNFTEIAQIRAEVENFLIEPEEASRQGSIESIFAPEPNLVQVKATDTWALGIRGQGTVIANIDSGVRHTHEALVNQYRGNLGGGNFNHNYNWLDPDGGSAVPIDANGHGTHVMGTMVGYDGGANEIGVAPEAEWIACRGCLTSSCPSTALLSCAQWIAAPYAIGNPGSADPNMRPYAVNNSWGNCQQTYNDWYQGVVDAWHAAGVYPVFANGNASNCGYSSPPGLNTVGNPARYGNVTGVGSSGTSNGLYAPHSNWGPTDNPDTVNPQPGFANLKPQVIAPGVSIRSSVPSSDSAYQSSGWTGTSMSAPHVTGMIALIWEAAGCLIGDYATTETIIEQSARPVPYASGGTPPPGPGNVPNYATGWGEIDVLEAVQQAQAICGPSGTIEGTVTDSGSSAPVAGASIAATLDITTTKTATTNAAGEYVISFAPEGVYTMTANAFGYLPATITNVAVVSGTVTTQDIALDPAPSYAVSGVVTDANTGWPLYAKISVAGVPGSPFWNDPETGAYSITLPGGAAYDFTVEAFVAGYLAEDRAVGPFNSNVTEDFELDVDAVACVAPGYSLPYLYFENFEANNGNYTLSGAAPAPWQWGQPTAWPSDCADGTRCWGTNLTGNYNHSANETLTSPVIDLSGVTPGTTLFARWYQANHIEHHQWDRAFAEVSIDGGAWQVMWQNPPTPTVVEGWRELTYDVSAAAGTNVQLRWRFTSDSSVNFPGWYIDRVAIAGDGGCAPAAGGLVVGNVYDANTNSPLVGALVSSDSAAVVTVATPLDPNVDDAFYTIFSPAGSQVFTATLQGYSPDIQSVSVVANGTVGQDFNLGSGFLVHAPEPVEVTVEFGLMTTAEVELTNTGSGGLNFTAEVLNTVEEHFEGAFPPDGWSVVNYGGNCVWQRNDQVPSGRPNYAGGVGFSANADSDRCGSGSTMNTALISPKLDLSGADSAHLDFILSYQHLGATAFAAVDISTDDGVTWTTLQSWNTSQSATGPGLPVSISLNSHLGSADSYIRFHYFSPGWNWWYQVDQVEITIEGGEWLEIDTSGGFLAAGESITATLSFDASAVDEPGQYIAYVILMDDTLYNPDPITAIMNVTASPTVGLLQGVVQSQGYCDNNPFPAAGAEIVITSGANTWTRTADANGYYYIYLDESYGPVTVTANAPQHISATAMGVALVGQQTTEQDFDLRWLQPCLDVDPTSMDQTVAVGQTATQMLTLGNSGAISLTFELREQDGGFTPAFSIEVTPKPEDIGTNWETMAPLPSGRVFSAVVADQNGYVYVMGGTSDGEANVPTSTNYRYNTATNTWDTMAPIPVTIDSIDAIEINNKIYIPGGATTAVTYVYDIAANTWSNIPANGGYTARSQYQVVAIGTDMYVLGGIVASASASTPEVWKLDTTTGTWTASASMQRTRTSFSAAAIDGVIYVAGGVAFPGFAPDMTAEKFDGASWSYIAPVPGGGTFTRWSYNADAHGADGLWLAAGRRDTDWNVLNHAGYYDPNTDTWTTSPTIPTLAQGRVYMEGDVATDGYFYVIGGRDGAGSIAYANNERLYVGSPASGDVEWLDQDPQMGVVAPDGGELEITVTFDASVVTELGEYAATIRVVSNDPMMGSVNIPVTMTVSEPEAAITLDVTVSLDDECGVADSLTVAPNTVVYYCYTVTNTGNIMLPNHTITDSVYGPMTSFIYDLMPGMSESVIVSKTITADAVSTVQWMAEHPGMEMSAMAEDTVSVTLTMRYIFLPIIMKP